MHASCGSEAAAHARELGGRARSLAAAAIAAARPLPHAGVSWAAGFAVITGSFVLATTVFILGAMSVGYK